MRFRLAIGMVTCGLISCVSAQQPVIIALEPDGMLNWSNAYPNAVAWIEWSADVGTTQEWLEVYSTLTTGEWAYAKVDMSTDNGFFRIGNRPSTSYEEDFEGTIGPEWSKPTTSVTPVGDRRFLGQFGSEEIMLTIDPMPTGQYTVTYELFIMGSWDGVNGPDMFELNAVGNSNLLITTFCNVPSQWYPTYAQNYPDAYPGPTYVGKTGAAEVDSLGYTDSTWGDSVYQLSSTFQHTGGPLQLSFSASLTGSEGVNEGDNERWGIDNLSISSQP